MKRSIVILLAASLLASGIESMAAEKAPATMDACNTLAADFDTAAKANPGAPKLNDAMKKRDHALTECKAGKYEEGVKGLRHALAEIGARTPAN
jgi:hypothetical protein